MRDGNRSTIEAQFRCFTIPEFRIWAAIGVLVFIVAHLGSRNVTEEKPLPFRGSLFSSDVKEFLNGVNYPSPVDWFSLRIRTTAIYELFRSHFGTHQSFDQRNQWASSRSPKASIDKDYYDPARQFYVYEFIADTGDGYELTYAMAKQLTGTSNRLQFLNSTHVNDNLLRESYNKSDALIFGGDLVYPHPSALEMLNRLIHPFASARSSQRNSPSIDVWAIPGNHDWLDGLKTFQEIFLKGAEELYTKVNTFIGIKFDIPLKTRWQCNQQKPWFFIRLSQNWYMIGIDDQIGSDIDIDQFTQISQSVQDLVDTNSHFELVLVMHQPAWYPPSTVSGLRTRLLRYLWGTGHVRAIFAGDKHHFSYYRADDTTYSDPIPKLHFHVLGSEQQSAHLFVAGGGGAFLHPTHTLPDQINWNDMTGDFGKHTRTIQKKSVYPSEEQSLWLTFQVHRILVTDMGILLVSVHVLTFLIPELQFLKIPTLLFILWPMLLPVSSLEWSITLLVPFILRMVDYFCWHSCKGWKCLLWIPASYAVIMLGFLAAAQYGDNSADTVFAGMGLTDFKNMIRIIIEASTENLIVVPIGFDTAPNGLNGEWAGKLIDGPFVIEKGPPFVKIDLSKISAFG